MGRNRFVNRHIQNLRRSLWDFILWKTRYYRHFEVNEPPPADFLYPATPQHHEQGRPSAMWVGHSTYLIEFENLNILTDPVWSSYCSPVPLKVLKRHSLPPLPLSGLPRIDMVLISHNHYDHLDAKTVKTLHQFYPEIQWVVPEKLSFWFHKRKMHNVIEIPWWQTHKTAEYQITAVPAQHFSGRSLWDQNKTHWNGYVLQVGNKRLYFTGDTGYNAFDFKEIGQRCGPMDLSLIPIGTYIPSCFMQTVHISPKEAVQIHQEVGSRFSLGMHWNTFRLSEEPLDRPPYDLYLAMQEKGLPFETFLPIEMGTYVNF